MRARLILAGWVLLTLISLYVFAYNLYWMFGFFQDPPLRLQEQLASAGISLALFFAFNVIFMLSLYGTYFAVAQLLMLRRSQDRFPVLAAVVLLTFGTANAVPLVPEYLTFLFNAPAYFAFPYFLNNFLAFTLIAAFLVSYPDGQFVPRWTLWLAIAGFVASALITTNAELFSKMQGFVALVISAAIIVGYGLILYAQIWRYRHYLTPLQKQQIKWFLFGAAVALITFAPTIPLTPVLLDPATPLAALLLIQLLVFGLLALPISVGISVLKYRLWDIDIIIRKTLTYALLAVLLALVYFGCVIVLQQVFATISGQRSEVITVVSTLAIAALFVPLRNRLQALIDRRFYRKKYDAQAVLNQFSVAVRDETDLEKLTGNLVGVVKETMQPRSVSLWLKGIDERRETR